MIRLSTLFWMILVSATGLAMFAVKYEVQALADELTQTTKKAAQTEHEIRVLDAEWAYLNRPDALAQMNQRYLSLAPIATKQLYASVNDIPMRPAPPPVAQPVVAAAEPTPATPTDAPAAAPPPSTARLAKEPKESVAPVVTAVLDTPAPARSVPVRVAYRQREPQRARSLDALIAQIVERR
jgi:hypothetical protein